MHSRFYCVNLFQIGTSSSSNATAFNRKIERKKIRLILRPNSIRLQSERIQATHSMTIIQIREKDI